jgi:hypothetical protein
VKLVAALSWYSEPVAWLAELVSSLGRVGVDHVVAVDGAYFLYPKGRARSESDQADVIQRTAAGCGMGCTVHVPDQPWIGNEVEKRDFLFRLAAAVTTPFEDWIWVCDGDEVVMQAPDIRQKLKDTGLDVAEALLVASDDPQHEEGLFPIRKFFRAQDGPIRVVGNHYTYVAPDGEVLWTYSDAVQAEAETFRDVRIWHRVNQRPAYRVLQRANYYARRDQQGIES